MADRKPVQKIVRRAPVGAAPGTLVADPASKPTSISVIAYDSASVEEFEVTPDADFSEILASAGVVWINITGLADIGTIESIGNQLNLHRLAIEDVINVHQRPKCEEFDDHFFVVTRMPHPNAGRWDTEQISLFFGRQFLVTFQEQPGDVFEPVRDRIRQKKGRIRERGTDYLAYALIDAVIDSYFPVLEIKGEELEKLEDTLLTRAQPQHMERIHEIKRDLLDIRRSIWPQREMINGLVRAESDLIADSTKIYMRDCYDHIIQLTDLLETYREIASGLVEIYLSSLSNRLNEVMRVLTVIATIFMPLSFLTGLYGMNFDRGASPWNMPELGWTYGYPFALLLMGCVVVGFVTYFKARGWVGGRWNRRRR